MTIKIKLLICSLFFGITAAPAQDDEITVKQVTDHLKQRYEMIDDATIKFEKHVKLGLGNIKQDFNGTLKMKKPNHYCVVSDYLTFVTDGKTVWAYSPVNNQVVVDNYKENSNTISPEQFMLDLPDDYYTSLLNSKQTDSGTIIQLKLVPKDDRSFLKSVKLSIEKESWLIREIIIADVNETETTYIVKDVKLNTNIPDKIFTFEPPAGAEVVDIR
jgi:outer membrane lipoprotein carrier protein